PEQLPRCIKTIMPTAVIHVSGGNKPVGQVGSPIRPIAKRPTVPVIGGQPLAGAIKGSVRVARKIGYLPCLAGGLPAPRAGIENKGADGPTRCVQLNPCLVLVLYRWGVSPHNIGSKSGGDFSGD